MCYNGLNNMFFPLCQINDNHSVTSPSHTKKTKSDNYRKHHKSTLIDNKALSLFKMDDHEKVIGLIQKMKRIYDSLPSGKITKETDRKIGNDSNLLIVFYVQIMPDDFVMQLHRF